MKYLPHTTLIMIVLLAVQTVFFGTVSVQSSETHQGRVSVLLIGEFHKIDDTSWPMMRSDPRLVLTLVPAGDLTSPDLTARFVRIYMPRRYEDLYEKFDVVYHFDFVPQALTDIQITWIHDAIRDQGLGFAMAEMGWYPSGDYWSGNDAEGWMNTILYQAYPCDIVIGWRKGARCFEKAIDSPLVDLPGFEQAPLGIGGGLHIARAGSTVHAYFKPKEKGVPAMVTGTYGTGKTFMTPTAWDLLPSIISYEWPFFIDFVVNPLYFVSGTPIPEDLLVVHKLRKSFLEYNTDKRMVVSLIEFLDKWGVSVRTVEGMLEEAGELRRSAEVAYLSNDYEQALGIVEDATAGILEILESSGKLKKQALFWVYLIEWSVVTGTLMISGTVLWFLMMRRGLYKEIGVTSSRTD